MPNACIKCFTSFWYARRVRADLRLANQISSSGIPASWSTLIRATAPRLDGTIAFMVLFVPSFFAVLVSDLTRDNPVYHVLAYHGFAGTKSGVMHTGILEFNGALIRVWTSGS